MKKENFKLKSGKYKLVNLDTKIKEGNPDIWLYHSTSIKKLKYILENGLSPNMTATEEDEARQVMIENVRTMDSNKVCITKNDEVITFEDAKNTIRDKGSGYHQIKDCCYAFSEGWNSECVEEAL